MKITIDYNNNEIRIEEAGPVATFKIVRDLHNFEAVLEEIFNRMSGLEDRHLEVELLIEDEDKRRVIGEW